MGPAPFLTRPCPPMLICVLDSFSGRESGCKGEEAGVEEAFLREGQRDKSHREEFNSGAGRLAPSKFNVWCFLWCGLHGLLHWAVSKKERREGGWIGQSAHYDVKSSWGQSDWSLCSHNPWIRALKWISMWPSKESFSIDPSSGKGFSCGFWVTPVKCSYFVVEFVRKLCFEAAKFELCASNFEQSWFLWCFCMDGCF